MVRPVVDPEVMSELTTVSRWKSLAMCLLLWAAILGLCWAGHLAWHSERWWLAFVVVALMPGLQHHLLIIAHDGSHGLVHPSLKWNDLIVDVFAGVPNGTVLRFYRVYHLLHHKYQGTSQDPEVWFYATQAYDDCRRGKAPFWKLFLFDWLGGAHVTMTRFYTKLVNGWAAEGRAAKVGLRDVALFVAIWGIGGALAWRFDVWKEVLLFWLLPAWFTIGIFKTRGYGEHTLYEGENEYLRTWTHQLNPIEHYYFFPLNIGYHLEHHFFPRVPWYNLKKLRRHLIAKNPDYLERSEPVTVRSYFFDRKSMLRRMIRGETTDPTYATPPVAAPRT
jgi:fatty acid desaturase